jgi:hypothetical protein
MVAFGNFVPTGPKGMRDPKDIERYGTQVVFRNRQSNIALQLTLGELTTCCERFGLRGHRGEK